MVTPSDERGIADEGIRGGAGDCKVKMVRGSVRGENIVRKRC